MYMYMYLLACQLFDILLVICFPIYDSQLTTDDSRFVWIILCPLSRTTQGEISIEFESRNVEKCNEFMELFIVTAKWRKDIFMAYSFDKHSCHISYWNLFVWKCTWVNSLQPIWRQWRMVAALLANLETVNNGGNPFSQCQTVFRKNVSNCCSKR